MFLRPVRTSQPQGPARIDWSNPITRGLVVAFNPASGIHNLVDGKQPVVLSGLTRKIAGVVTLSGNPAQIGWATGKSDSFSYFSRTIHRNGSVRVGGLFSASSQMNFYFEGFASGQAVRLTRFNGSNYSTRLNSGYIPSEGQLLNLGVRVNANVKLFIDGNSYGENTSDGDTSLIEQAGLMYRQGGSLFPDNVQGTHAYFCWGRDLTDTEFKSIADNPWQIFAPDAKSLWVPDTVSAGGGATPITSDASTSYAIRAAITSDAAASYPVRAATSSDTTAAYPLRAATQSDTAAAYAIRSAASADALASYYVLGLVQSDTAGSYAVRAAAQSDALASYAVRSAVQSDALASYEILSAGVVFSDSPASYAIRATVQADGAASYPVRSVAQADAAGAYAVRSAVWSDAGASYAVQGALVSVWADATASYFVDGVVISGVYPSQTTVLAGVQYGPTGVEYTGMLTIGGTGPTAAEIAEAVWQQAARTLTSGSSLAPTAAENAAAVQAALAANLALLDVAVSSRVATGTIVKANVLAIKDQTVLGEGTQANPWRPA